MLSYHQQEAKSLKEQRVKLDKYKNFIQENIEALEGFPTKLYKLENVDILVQVSTIFDRCKIAAMVAESNSVPLPSPIDDEDYNLSLGNFTNRNKRNITEESDIFLEKKLKRVRYRNKNVKAEDSILQKLVVSGDNDPLNELEPVELLIKKELADPKSKDVGDSCTYIIEQDKTELLTKKGERKQKTKKRYFWMCMCSK